MCGICDDNIEEPKLYLSLFFLGHSRGTNMLVLIAAGLEL